MLKRIIPVLLLSNRGLVKTQHFHNPKYIGDPINAEKIVLNNVLLSNPGLASEMILEFGASSVVACVDVKKNIFGKYRVYSYVQEKTIDMDFGDYLKMC